MATRVDESLNHLKANYASISTANTIAPRYIAAMIDNTLAMLLSVMAAKSIDEDAPVIASAVLFVSYLGYFFLSELQISRTPGKFLTGLVVVGLNGERCTLRQIAVRTAFRLLEVNPILLGAIPAALSVVFSANHQRFGDKVAKTLVVESRVLKRHR